jgi:hypothetical protein
VKDHETFENLVEDDLNRALVRQDIRRYEILNLSVGGYGVLRKLVRLERDGFAFAPNTVLFAISGGDRTFDLDDMLRTLEPGSEQPFDYLNQVFKQAGVDHLDYRDGSLLIKHRLQLYLPDIYKWAFERLRDLCAQRGVGVIVLYRPPSIDPAKLEPTRCKELVDAAVHAGLEVIDLSSAFEEVEDRHTLVLSPWDDHTNAVGHRLLADTLFEQLRRKMPEPSPTNVE